MSHVVPDLVQKILKGQDPLHILGDGSQIRHYTYGGDLAKGIVSAVFSKEAENNDFNISTNESTTVLELAELIWDKIHCGKRKFKYVSDQGYDFDVQRVPDVSKARQVLGVSCETTLNEMLDEVIPWIERAIAENRI